MTEMNTPRFLLRKGFLLATVAFVVAFSVIYLSIYQPYSDTFWLSLADRTKMWPTLLFYLFSIGILFSAKSVMFSIQKSKGPAGFRFILTVIAEWLLISALYVFFSHYVLDERLDVTAKLCLSSLFCCATILVIPYTICLLYAAYRDKAEELAAMKALTASSEISMQYKELISDFIEFRDSGGILRLTVDSASVYYIESQDNYVNITYLLDDNLESYLMRCRTRDIDELLKDKNFCRCHRSYIVNPEHIKTFFCRNSAHGRILLDHPKAKEIPVSKTYMQSLDKLLPPEKIQY